MRWTKCAVLSPVSAEVKPQSIVHCRGQGLLGPQVPLRGLHGGMAKQQLNLLELPSRFPAQFCARTPQVMGRELAQLGLAGVADDQSPDDLLVQYFASLHNASPGHRPER